MIASVIKSGLLAAVVTYFCIALLAPVAEQIGLCDRPGGRKQHGKVTPVVGGIALFFGFCFGLLTLNISLSDVRGLLAGGATLLLLGVVDDIKDISQRMRLLGQVFAAFLIIVWGGYELSSLGDLFLLGNIQLGLWGIPLTLLVVVCYLNAFNMIDGQDGLAGSIGFTQFCVLAALFYYVGLYMPAMIVAIAAIVTFAFLTLNIPLPWRKHARVFLGDAGSTIIAYITIWFALQLSQSHHAGFRPIDAVWVVSYPVFDCMQVVFYRITHSKSPLQGGREHLHHILLSAGWSRTQINFTLLGFTLLLVGLGMLLHSYAINELWTFLSWLASLLIYVFLCNSYLDHHVDNQY